MAMDPKEKDKTPVPPSEQIINAHASGDGALEPSDDRFAMNSEDPELRAEDDEHIPY
jgi:hypothetical protein